MDNVFERIETDSESSDNESSSSSNSGNSGDFTEAFPNHFLNMEKKEDYLINRNKLFTPDLITKFLVINKTTTSNVFTIDFDADLKINPMKNVIGFTLRKAFSKYTTDNNPYLTIDIIIDEIPHEACRVSNIDDNPHIIDRIPTHNTEGSVYHYQPIHSLVNHFFPISLDKLSFTIKPWITGDSYATLNSDSWDLFFEFEITIVNNLELLK